MFGGRDRLLISVALVALTSSCAEREMGNAPMDTGPVSMALGPQEAPRAPVEPAAPKAERLRDLKARIVSELPGRLLEARDHEEIVLRGPASPATRDVVLRLDSKVFSTRAWEVGDGTYEVRGVDSWLFDDESRVRCSPTKSGTLTCRGRQTIGGLTRHHPKARRALDLLAAAGLPRQIVYWMRWPYAVSDARGYRDDPSSEPILRQARSILGSPRGTETGSMVRRTELPDE